MRYYINALLSGETDYVKLSKNSIPKLQELVKELIVANKIPNQTYVVYGFGCGNLTYGFVSYSQWSAQ